MENEIVGENLITNEQSLRRSTRIKNKPNIYGCVTNAVEEVKTHGMDPKTLEEALSSKNSERWKIAMDEEIRSLMKNKTWT